MKKLLLILLAVTVSCTEKTDKTVVVTAGRDSLQNQNDSLRKVIDTLRRPEAFTADTLAKDAARALNGSGRHPITLHWISWTKQGEAVVEPLADGRYQIVGSQANDSQEYLNIVGTIKKINDRELEFEGTVETHIHTNNGGEPCIKTGKQLFKRTGSRKYYRMQDMENCMGGRVVDYIDIYPGTSGLMN